MIRHPIAEAVLALGRADEVVHHRSSTLEHVVGRIVRSVTAQLHGAARGHRELSDGTAELIAGEVELRRTITATMAAVSATIQREARMMRHDLWLQPSQAPFATHGNMPHGDGGHLREFTTTGEPQLPPGFRYEPTPLRMPGVIDIDIAQQHEAGYCYLVAAVDAVAHWNPDALRAMVRRDPDDESFMIVRVHGGTYRLHATLPVDARTGLPAFVTSPDGSTLAAYILKAGAAHMGSWSDLVRGLPHRVCEWLVGESFTSFSRSPIGALTDAQLRQVMSTGSLGTVSMPRWAGGRGLRSLLGRRDLGAQHTFVIKDVDHRDRVTLHNPRGRPHPARLSIRELKMLGAILSWADCVG